MQPYKRLARWWQVSMNKDFPENEKLYRAVFPETQRPLFWKKNGKVSSAAFKDKNGLSVERGNFRSDENVIQDMKTYFSGSIISVTVEQCAEVNAVVKYLPSSRSKYHSEIHSSNEKILLTDRQAKHLANSAIIEYKE